MQHLFLAQVWFHTQVFLQMGYLHVPIGFPLDSAAETGDDLCESTWAMCEAAGAEVCISQPFSLPLTV